MVIVVNSRRESMLSKHETTLNDQLSNLLMKNHDPLKYQSSKLVKYRSN